MKRDFKFVDRSYLTPFGVKYRFLNLCHDSEGGFQLGTALRPGWKVIKALDPYLDGDVVRSDGGSIDGCGKTRTRVIPAHAVAWFVRPNNDVSFGEICYNPSLAKKK